jgi:hypothetical protein
MTEERGEYPEGDVDSSLPITLSGNTFTSVSVLRRNCDCEWESRLVRLAVTDILKGLWLL